MQWNWDAPSNFVLKRFETPYNKNTNLICFWKNSRRWKFVLVCRSHIGLELVDKVALGLASVSRPAYNRTYIEANTL